MVGLLFAFMPVLAGNSGPDKASRLEVVQLLIKYALLMLRTTQQPASSSAMFSSS